MHVVTKRWQVPPRLTPEAERALRGYPPILGQILYNRGYATHEAAQKYLEAHPPSVTDPFRMLHVDTAVRRLIEAIRERQKIVVYGDYDVDGVTGAALLVQALEAWDAQVSVYIPNRFDEGYGLNTEALTFLKEEGAQVVVTVDCGVRSFAEADYARDLGLDLIVTDHHHPGDRLPSALAVINPKRTDDPYPEKDLAGVGVAYKLACALYERMSGDRQQPKHLLDLVALGTVADLAPLVNENRYLVRAGLQQMGTTHREGLLSLMRVAGVMSHRVTARDIGFALGPRLNAAGRLDSAIAAYELLITDDLTIAGRITQRLDAQNRERQEITRQIQTQVEEQTITEDEVPLLLFAADPDFSLGVVGLAASRLAEKYYRPAIVAQQMEEYVRGSCRSIPEFHITKALDECSDLLIHHGGHAAAAGFTLHAHDLEAFCRRVGEIAKAELATLDLRPTLTADAEVALKDLKPEVLEYLSWLEPTGYGNPEAVFVTRDLKVGQARQVGNEGKHLKFTLSDGWVTFDAIAFRQGHWYENLPDKVDVLYTFELNVYNGYETLQLNVRDIKAAAGE
ncbi:MAG: single-stranded-DNA-specific exonuclease RecJ [Chloroflexota bacterium]